MQHSIKAKRDVYDNIDFLDFPPCPEVPHKDYLPTWTSFITTEEHIEEAYWLAKYVFDMAFKNQTFTNPSKNDPWTLTTAIKVHFNEDIVNEYLVQILIVKLKGIGKYSFTFKRLQGDPLSYSKIWQQIEPLILAKRSADGRHLVFQDACDYSDDEDDAKYLETEKTNITALVVSGRNSVEDGEEIEDKVKGYEGDEFSKKITSVENAILMDVGVSV